MTTKIDIIGSDTQTSFSSVPTVQTQTSTSNSTKLASLGFVTGLINTTYLDKTTNQTLSGAVTVTNSCTLNNIDTPVGANETLTIGQSTSLGLNLPILTLRSVLQNIRYWAVGTPLTTTTTGTAVVCQRMQTGQVSVASATSIPISFIPAFTSKPAIFLGVQGTTSTLVSGLNKWITLADANGFTANYGGTQANVVLNWMAIGT